MRPPALVIHGGTGGRLERQRMARIRRSLRLLASDGVRRLRTASALEVVVWVVARLEDDPLFNAGTGSTLQRDGQARLTSAVMDGATRRFAAVLNIEGVRHPVEVARRLLAEADRVVAGPGATRFARACGLPVWDPVTPLRRRQWQRRLQDPDAHGTVGAVALDRAGCLAAATSTGGKGFERVGRVSDSGLPVGNYADECVAISCTGLGEEIIEEGLAVRLAQQVAEGHSLPRAVARTFRNLARRARHAGTIGIDRYGRWAWGTTYPVLYAVAQRGTRRLDAFCGHSMKILYAGDSEVGGAANYLLAILRRLRATTVHVPPSRMCTARLLTQHFDAIILSDFPRAQMPRAAQVLLRNHVRQGSGLLMVGGWESFSGSGGGWRGSVVESLLPVRCLPGDDRRAMPGGALLVPSTPHPMFRELVFSQPPVICGLNRVQLRPRGCVLLSARPLRAEGRQATRVRPGAARYPLLIIDTDPNRRIAALTTDLAPHWCGGLVDWGARRVRLPVRAAIEVEIGNRYLQFVSTLLQWLTRSHPA